MTRTPHIAMFGVPAHGHVNPSLPVIRELVDRGYRVTYSITEEFAPLVEAVGATPVCYRSTLPWASDPTMTWPADYVEGLTVSLDEAIAVLPQLAAAYDGDRPDLVLYDLAGYPARILATRWGIPIVQLSPTFVAWDGFEEWMAPLVARGMRRQPAGTDVFGRFATWLAEHGIGGSVDEFLWRPQRCIALIPRALQPHADRVPDSCTFVGPDLADRARQAGWEPPQPGRPVLLISLGSVYTKTPQFYRRCIDAFGDLGWHVVMATGRYVDPTELGPLPSNFEVHRWVPQPAVLSRASAFVTHAGPAGISEALHHAVPMVAVPQALDQHTFAARLVELGVGRQLSRGRATAEVLRDAVLGVAADVGVATRLAAMQQELRRSGGGAAAAADLVEQQLPTGRRANGAAPARSR